MERNGNDMESYKIGNYLRELRNANRFDEDVYNLVEADLKYGLEKEQVELYLKKNFKLPQMKILSNHIRNGADESFIDFIISLPELTGYQAQTALDFYKEGVSIETIEDIIGKSKSANEMKVLCQSALDKLNEVKLGSEAAPEYMKELVEQIVSSFEGIKFQQEIYEELNRKFDDFVNSKTGDNEKEELLKKCSDAEALVDSQQTRLNQADSTIARLREQIRDKDKEMNRMQTRIDKLEDKLLDRADMMSQQGVIGKSDAVSSDSTLNSKETKIVNDGTGIKVNGPEENSNMSNSGGIVNSNTFASSERVPNQNVYASSYATPIYYQVPVVDARGQVVKRVFVDKNKRKTEVSLASIFGKISFKKKSKQDIVKLVASGDLVPAQLVQIKAGMEKGLTEGQLVELINNNVSAEKMKEIIEIAVLENSMDY